jgi:hypothetical protein
VTDAEKLEKKLTGEEGQAGGDEHRPGHRRWQKPHRREPGNDEPQNRQLGRRELVQPQAGRDERQSPEQDDGARQRDVPRPQRRRNSAGASHHA